MMRPTEQTLLVQMGITDITINQRKQMLTLTDADVERLSQYRSLIEEHLESIVDRFYEVLTASDEVATLIGDADTLQRLRSAQKRYIVDLFDGFYDMEYVNDRLRIGLVHKRIGVGPKLYLASILTLKNLLLDVILESADPSEHELLRRALDKVFYFDNTFVFDTYIRSLVSEIEVAKAATEEYAKSLEQKVAERTQELELVSRTDALTSLSNQRSLREHLRRDLKYAERYGLPVSLIYFDIDEFKQINDANGHEHGNEVLRTIGKILLQHCREIDTPCRYGGDEFCVVMQSTNSHEARICCDRIIESIRKEIPSITISVGIAQSGKGEAESGDDLIRRADAKMYEAKKTEGFAVSS